MLLWLFITPIAAWIIFGAISLARLRRCALGDRAYVFSLLSSAETQTNLLAAGRAIAGEYSRSGGRRIDLGQIPEAILSVHPRDMFIYRDQIHIRINSPGRRTFIVCFVDGADEFGTQVLTNGLWYWNINMSGDDFPALQRLRDRRKGGERPLWVCFEREGIQCAPYFCDK